MLYPTIASWFSAVRSTHVVEAYVEQSMRIDPADRAVSLSAADAYNADDVRGLIVDPFSNTEGAQSMPLDDAAREYLDELALDPDGVMGRITIPAIGVDLPIRHGTTDDTLREGVGHLYGSSLPVGGVGTHAVLTGHSGIPDATLFTDISKLEPGDEITIDVLDRDLVYRVTGSEVVDPTEIGELGVVPGEDLLTLVTCTPIGINTHRLLVHAERVDDPGPVALPDAPGVPFPWWIPVVLAALAAWGLVVFRPLRRRKRA